LGRRDGKQLNSHSGIYPCRIRARRRAGRTINSELRSLVRSAPMMRVLQAFQGGSAAYETKKASSSCAMVLTARPHDRIRNTMLPPKIFEECMASNNRSRSSN
jgi:hypothetical protein